MTPEKESEMQFFLDRYVARAKDKFERGAKEHGGSPDDFDSMTPLEHLYNALDENIDQFFYLSKAIKQLEQEQ